MKTKVFEDIVEENLSDSSTINGLRARSQNYPLHKPMVYYDHDRIMAIRGREVHDKVNGQLFKGEGVQGGDGNEWGNGRMSVDLVLLTDGASINEIFDKGCETQPPEVTLRIALVQKMSMWPEEGKECMEWSSEE